MVEIVEGWTSPMPFTLKGNGTPIDLSGMTVTLSLKDRRGASVDTAGKVTVTSAIDGEVTFSPAVGDLRAGSSPYAARFQVTDSNSKVLFVPNAEADAWKVRPA